MDNKAGFNGLIGQRFLVILPLILLPDNQARQITSVVIAVSEKKLLYSLMVSLTRLQQRLGICSKGAQESFWFFPVEGNS